MKIHNPSEFGALPSKYASIYSHAIETTYQGGRQLYISGQVGNDSAGELSTQFVDQLTQALNNVETVLASADMTKDNIVKVIYYLTQREDLDDLVKIRATVWHGIRPAVTVVLVDGLVNLNWLVEVDVIAHEELA